MEIFDKRTLEWSKCKELVGIQNTSNSLVVIDQVDFKNNLIKRSLFNLNF